MLLIIGGGDSRHAVPCKGTIGRLLLETQAKPGKPSLSFDFEYSSSAVHSLHSVYYAFQSQFEPGVASSYDQIFDLL